MRLEQKERQFLGIEIRSTRYGGERRNVRTCLLLIGADDVTRGAPTFCEFCTMIRIGRRRRRQGQNDETGDKKQTLARRVSPGANSLDAHQNRLVSQFPHWITSCARLVGQASTRLLISLNPAFGDSHKVTNAPSTPEEELDLHQSWDAYLE